MSVRDEAHRIAWSKFQHTEEPAGCVTVLRALIDEYDRLRAEWIDPQRIVDLAKQYTDEGKPGWVELHFHDRAAEWAKPWYVITPGDARSSMHEGDTATDALKEAEA